MTKLAVSGLEELIKSTQQGSLVERSIALGAAAMLARFLHESEEMKDGEYAQMVRILAAVESGIRREVEV